MLRPNRCVKRCPTSGSSGKCKSKLHSNHFSQHTAVYPQNKKQRIASVGEDVENMKPFYTVGGNVKYCSHFANHEVSKKIKSRAVRWSNNPTCLSLCKTIAFRISKRYRTPVYSSIYDSQVMETIQMSMKYTTEYYSSFKKKEVLLVATWVNLGGIRSLKEAGHRRQARRDAS